MCAHEKSEVLGGLSPSADQPIATRDQDRLRRAGFAGALATQLRASTESSLVMALTGPWGTGKTSLLNLIEDSLGPDGPLIVRFNPWLFSGTEQLVSNFFDELASQVVEKSDGKLDAVGVRLRQYGELLSPLKVIPVVGSWIDLAAAGSKAVGGALQTSDPVPPSLRAQRETIAGALREAGKKIVVMVDDIDRLEDDEIRHVMRLVRLVGDFPNLVYLLAFDSRRVASVLARGNQQDGHRYLEKIVQLMYPVPAIGRTELRGLLAEEVERALGVLGDGAPRERAADVVDEIVATLVTNVRDVRRYANVLPFSLSLLGREVAVADILALEAVRLFVPGAFDQLQDLLDLESLEEAQTGDEDEEPNVLSDLAERLLISSDGHERAIVSLMKHVLPTLGAARGDIELERAARASWSEQRRVADSEFLRIYFEKALPANAVPSTAMAELVDALVVPGAFAEALAKFSDAQFTNVVGRLATHVPEEMRVEDAHEAIGAVIGRVEGMTDKRRPSVRSVPVPRGLIEALVRAVVSPVERASLLSRSGAECRLAYVHMRLVDIAAGMPRRDPLVARSELGRLQRQFKDRVLAMTAEELAEEPAMARIINWVASIDQTSLGDLLDRTEVESVLIHYLDTTLTVRPGTVPAVLGERQTVLDRVAAVLERMRESGDSRLRRIESLYERMSETSAPRSPSGRGG